MSLSAAARRSAAPVQRLGVADVDHRERAVVFVMARFEHADHRELLEARHHPGRRDRACGATSVTLSPTVTPRLPASGAEHDAELAGHQIVEAAGACACRCRTPCLERRLDAAQQHAAHRVLA
jgi:hypothetical protein